MNKDWSELCKIKQEQLKKEITFDEGIQNLLLLRKILMEQMEQFRTTLSKEQFSSMPYINAKGYHNKTVAYGLYHVFRIEDIVANTIIQNTDEVFFAEDYQHKMNSSIITTGNELVKEAIGQFSEQLNLSELYKYIKAVDKKTTKLIKSFSPSDMRRKITAEDKQRVINLHVVSKEPIAEWLVDYWCNKNILGLIQTPLSRHWIMHIEASLRIINKLK